MLDDVTLFRTDGLVSVPSRAGLPPALDPRLPSGWVLQPNGLLVPAESTRVVVTRGVGLRGLPRSEAQFTLMVRRIPDSLDQMLPHLAEGELGLHVSDLDRLRRIARRLYFTPAMIAAGLIAGHLGAGRWGLSHHYEVAESFLVTDRERLDYVLQAIDAGRPLVGKQGINALLRLILEHAHPGTPLSEQQMDGQAILFERLLLGVTALTGHDDLDSDVGRDWLPFVTRNSAFHSSSPLYEDLVRTYSLFVHEPAEPAMAAHPARVDLEALLFEASGVSIKQQMAVALGLLGGSGISDPSLGLGQRCVLGPAHLDSYAELLDVPVERLEALLVADRDWYRWQFAERGDSEERVVWDRVPFEQRPLLRLPDRRLLVVSPQALMSWMTDGLYHRALNAAPNHRARSRFQEYFGALGEALALRVVRDVHPGPRPAGSGLVHGEQRYRDRKTPDIAVDLGPDLVLIEVTTRRLTSSTRIDGDRQQVETDLDRMIGAKARQMSARIDDLLAGAARLPDVDVGVVRRIWPVFVSDGDIIENPVLWEFLDEVTGGALKQPRVQPPTLLDFGELDILAALVEAGHSLADVLAIKTQDVYRRMDFARFVNEHPSVPSQVRSRLVHERMDALWRDLAPLFDADAHEFEQRRCVRRSAA